MGEEDTSYGSETAKEIEELIKPFLKERGLELSKIQRKTPD
jgi:3-dehydroquinate dehydratase